MFTQHFLLKAKDVEVFGKGSTNTTCLWVGKTGEIFFFEIFFESGIF